MNEVNAIPKKPPIRFYRPLYRTATAILPLVVVSILCELFAFMFAGKASPLGVYILAAFVYGITQFAYLRRYIFQRPSLRRFICTNILAYLAVIAFSIAASYGFVLIWGAEAGQLLYTKFFMPMQIFSYLDLVSVELSTGISGLLAFLFSIVFLYLPVVK